MPPTDLQRLKNRSVEPPGGWRFTEPRTGREINGSHFAGCVEQTKAFLQANRLEVPVNLADIIEDQIALRVPASFRAASDRDNAFGMGTITFSQVRDFTSAIRHETKRHRFVRVHTEEAVCRKETCLACPLHRSMKDCLSCTGLIEWVWSWAGHPILRNDMEDKEVRVCGPSSTMVLAELAWDTETLKRIVSQHLAAKLPAACWKRSVLK
jgi:hypothetical protein